MDTLIVEAATRNLDRFISTGNNANFALIKLARKILIRQSIEADIEEDRPPPFKVIL